MSETCPSTLAQLQSWAAANPLKVQALVALIFANAPPLVVALVKALI